MTLQQLRALCEIADRNLNFSLTASALNTTQPAVSRMIRSLEQELGTEILVRSGKRMVRLTAQGEELLARARHILLEVHNIGRMGSEQKDARSGVMKIATTHTHASYSLVPAVTAFRAQYPRVTLHLRPGSPADIVQWVSKGDVDLGLNARPPRLPENVVALDAYPIERCVVAPAGHPLLRIGKPTAKDIAQYPIIDYDDRAQSGALLRSLFRQAGVAPNVAVTGTDATAVMAYVVAGLGIAIVQKQILRNDRYRHLRSVDASHLFPKSTTMFIIRRDAYLPSYMYDFIALVAPQWPRQEVDRVKYEVKKTR
jgi:DNA-binding transcriptional LysR family regulator